jgi:hypothetical protein
MTSHPPTRTCTNELTYAHTRNKHILCTQCCRLYLSPYDVSPTYKDVHNKYSVRYFLNLVLVDEEDRR